MREVAGSNRTHLGSLYLGDRDGVPIERNELEDKGSTVAEYFDDDTDIARNEGYLTVPPS